MHTIGKVFVSLRFPDGALRCPGTQVYILKKIRKNLIGCLTVCVYVHVRGEGGAGSMWALAYPHAPGS